MSGGKALLSPAGPVRLQLGHEAVVEGIDRLPAAVFGVDAVGFESTTTRVSITRSVFASRSTAPPKAGQLASPEAAAEQELAGRSWRLDAWATCYGRRMRLRLWLVVLCAGMLACAAGAYLLLAEPTAGVAGGNPAAKTVLNCQSPLDHWRAASPLDIAWVGGRNLFVEDPGPCVGRVHWAEAQTIVFLVGGGLILAVAVIKRPTRAKVAPSGI
jgi:hypothetical protein